MAFYIPPSPYPSGTRTASSNSLPRRTDSLAAAASAANPVFVATEDDLRDAQRVHSHGQEEDLRYALKRMITRVEELVRRSDN
jgi:hypothetical protein